MQLAVQYNLTAHQMDVKSAYLHAPIDCELFVEQPQGFSTTDKDGKHLVYKLKKSLYGLKQSGRNWNSLLHTYLVSEGFKQSQADYCVYTKITDDSLTVIVIWVDDLIIASSSLGRLSWFLGLEFKCEDGVIMMNQSQFIKRVLRTFNTENCKSRSTPCKTSTNKITEDESEPADVRLYGEIVGSLVYIMTSIRPDLSYSITKLSQHLDKPTLMHLNAAKHVLRYLKGTVDRNLVFRKSKEPLSISGFCDADWGASDDRRSITGYGFRLSSDGPLIFWKSRKQPTVALSTCEAEYMSLLAAVQEGKFLFQLWGSILDDSRNVFRSVTLCCDNQGALALANNPVQQQRSKHIDIRYHFVRSEIHKKVLPVAYVASKDNLADIFTKPINGPKIKTFVPSLFGK